jgi:hypothetical protein
LLLRGWVAYIPLLRWQFNGRPLVLIPVDDIATCHGQATIECPIILQWLFCCLNGDPDLGKSLTACQLPLSLSLACQATDNICNLRSAMLQHLLQLNPNKVSWI